MRKPSELKTNQFKLLCPHCGEPAGIIEVHNKKPKYLGGIVRLFIDERCYTHPEAKTPASRLYDIFKIWWDSRFACPPISQKKFGIVLGKRFKSVKSGTRFYTGIGILPDLKP